MALPQFDELLKFRYPKFRKIEQRKSEIVVKPVDVMQIEIYSDEEMARWDEEDLTPDVNSGHQTFFIQQPALRKSAAHRPPGTQQVGT